MKRGLFFIFAFCVISNAYADADCLQRPSCAELGYLQKRKMCTCFERDVLPCPFNIKDDNTVFCGDLNCKEKCMQTTSIYSGENNTKAILEVLDNKAFVPYAVSQFYVGDKNGAFGQGKWYVPAIGEWMTFVGMDFLEITTASNSGYIGDNLKLINASLKKLAATGVEAEILSGSYWSSTEAGTNNQWFFNTSWHERGHYYATTGWAGARAASFVKVSDTSTNQASVKVGDVWYMDNTYGEADTYDGTKIPVGVVASVSENGKNATILNLKSFTFSSTNQLGNFDPENPYGASQKASNYSNGQNIAEIQDYGDSAFLAAIGTACGCACGTYQCQGGNCSEYNEDCTCKSCLSLYTLDNGVCDANCPVQCQDALPLYDGKGFTEEFLTQLGDKAIASQAASQFYIGDKTGDFGQGKWYIPSLGEWYDIHGTNKCRVTLQLDIGRISHHLRVIQASLTALSEKGVEAQILSGWHWSSTFANVKLNWAFNPQSSGVEGRWYWDKLNLRLVCRVDGISAGSQVPQIGDILYTDKTYDSASNYDENKTLAGIVFAVSDDNKSVKIINLRDLTFSATNTIGNFDAENPYGGTETTTVFSIADLLSVASPYISETIRDSMNKTCRCSCEFE